MDSVKNSILIPALSGFLILALSGCLKTREAVKEQEQAQEMQTQVVTLQKQNAFQGNRFDEINENVRNLSGRVEVMEGKAQSIDKVRETDLSKGEKTKQEINEKMGLLQQELVKIEKELESLNKEIADLKVVKAQAAATSANGPQELYDKAESLFKEKSWKDAILTYQKYKDKAPKGKHQAEATYKIGVCFQELGMKDEAKAFYTEVQAKYAGSDQVKKAKSRLKTLK